MSGSSLDDAVRRLVDEFLEPWERLYAGEWTRRDYLIASAAVAGLVVAVVVLEVVQ